MNRQARNAEEASLALLSCCAWVTGEISQVKWPEALEPISAGTWLSRLMGQRSYQGFEASACLNHLDLSQCVLTGINLAWANLYGANLCGARLVGANLYGANLYGAN